MKNKHLSILVLSAGLCMGFALSSCQKTVNPGPDDGPVDTVKLEFEKATYEINSGAKITVKGDVEGVTYSFQGGTPEGVTLNSTTGEITYDEEGAMIPEKNYIASKGDETATCIIKFKIIEEVPEITIKNVSKYFVSGDRVVGEAISKNGTEFAIEYSLKAEVKGISIDPQTGIITFSSDVSDGTSFTVVATSKSVKKEFTFIAMTNNIVTSDTKMQIVKKGSKEDPKFVLNFNGNDKGDAETTKDNINYAIDNVIAKDNKLITYDKETKTVTISHELLNTLGSGEVDFKVLTQRNSVSLKLTIADNFIYTADDFYDIFEPNFDAGNPSYKEGSLAGYYVLGADIDLTEYLGANGKGYNGGKDWFPIGAYDDGKIDLPFEGTFNGNGHKISGFSYSKATNVNGMFGRIGINGVVKNFTIEGSIPEDGVGSWSGIVSGNNAGTIENIISNVSLPNGGHSATGVFASVNHGLIQNCISISTGVLGYKGTAQKWQRAGIAVGLNETDGVVKNTYAVSEKMAEDGTPKYELMGCSQTEAVTNENAGKLFTSLDELKAFDFSNTLTGDIWNVKTGEIPSLNVEFVPLSVGYMKINNKVNFVLKGDKLELDSTILPVEYAAEYKDKVVYEISGVEGAKVTNNVIDFSEITTGGKATVKATLKVGEAMFEDSISFNVFMGLESVTVNVKEDAFIAGSSYKLSATLAPDVKDVDVTYKLGSDIGWRKCYVNLNEATGEISINDDIPTVVESISVTATALGVTSDPVVIPVKHLNTLPNSNVIHYKGEEKVTFDYTLPEGKEAEKVVLGDTELTINDDFTVEGNVVKVKSDMIVSAAPNTQVNLRIADKDGAYYRAFATYSSDEKVIDEWLLNAFGRDGMIEINSMEDFNKYFAYDDKEHPDLVDNMKKVFVLKCDLDFSGVTGFRAIGKNLASGAKNVHFTGKFYGMGHTIKNYKMEYEARDYKQAGFFCQIDGGGLVRDLNFDNCSIYKPGGNNGGIAAAYLGGEGSLINVNAINCSVTIGDYIVGNNGGSQLGGLVGRPYTAAKYCTFNGYNINLLGVK